MEELLEILRANMLRRPLMEIRDAVKLIYQNEFGGGHLISDPQRAHAWLCEEMASCRRTPDELIEPIGNGTVRINLWPASGRISPDTLFRIFLLSSAVSRGDMERYTEKLRLVYDLGFDRARVDEFLEEHRRAGFPALSHSEAYRSAYFPAYRVVSGEYSRFLDVFSAVDRFDRFTGPIIIGIDGMCAAGKTTLGTALAKVYNGNLIHADDYYLPRERRTRERMEEPGGNMDRERLRDEVLEPLSRGQRVVTRRFDCGTMEYDPPVRRPSRRINIVEGSYSLHPELRDYYTLKIAMRTTSQLQLERLSGRGQDLLGSFIARWIPLEQRYFSSIDVFGSADIVIDT